MTSTHVTVSHDGKGLIYIQSAQSNYTFDQKTGTVSKISLSFVRSEVNSFLQLTQHLFHQLQLLTKNSALA